MTKNGTQHPEGNNQPMFYISPVPLHHERHGKAGIRTSSPTELPYARHTNSIPVLGPEMAEASKFYPLVFSNDATHHPLALVGLSDGVNVFINSKNEWQEHSYIPAYVRRYPFGFTEDVENKRFILCVDEASDRFKVDGDATGVTALFDKDGKPTEITNNALQFCNQYQHDYTRTLEYGKALAEHNLLKPSQVSLMLPSGKQEVLSGFSVLDEEKFRDLPANILQTWHKNGWLAFSYFHLISQSNWRNVTVLVK